MSRKLFSAATLSISAAYLASAQSSVPLYTVTVVDRTVSAVDYQYRTGPTPIDFRGTVLLPYAKGGAMVESKPGHTEIEAHFDHLLAPTRFGREYLTYVLWAISPDGHPKNLGEVLAGSSDKAHLRVTTDLQAFGLVVTAEPYAAVRQPGDVVVLENQPRPDTVGGTEPIQAKYELLPRGRYTYNVQDGEARANAPGEKLSPDQYQSVVEIYQAQNAMQIAQAAGAGQYAADTFAKAQDLLRQAQDARARKAPMNTTVTLARQASQTAEDARILTMERKHAGELASANDRVTRAEAARDQAEAARQAAQAQADSARALLEQERAGRKQAQAEAAAAAYNSAASLPPPPQPQRSVTTHPAFYPDDPQKKELRRQLLGQLGNTFPSLDTPRGITVTIPDSDFQGARLNSAVGDRMVRIAAILRAHPDLSVKVEGHETYSSERAGAVREALIAGGLPSEAVIARGWGDSRPIASNATAAGREQNCRVEIVVGGTSIGDLPNWAHSYQLAPGQ